MWNPFVAVKEAVEFLVTLFFSKKFLLHRVVGLSYLLQFAASLYLYFANYELYYNSILSWSMPLTGFMQSIIATYTFWFLPKKQKDPGYYGDKSTLSHTFVRENIFFSGLLLFQCVYMHDTYRPYVTDYVPVLIESSFVFFPYFVFRPFFEKTSFRDSLNVKDKNKTEENRVFFIVVTYITKAFYIWAKHYIGFFLNYARFLDRITPAQIHHIHLMLIFAGAATTISMFLHTLKFKKIIGPKSAYLWYMFSYLMTFYSWYLMFDVFFLSWDICLITFCGVIANFGPQWLQLLLQVAIAVVFNGYRHSVLPAEVTDQIFMAAPAVSSSTL